MGPVIWDFVKVVWGLAVRWVMGDTCGVGGLSCWGDGQVFVGDIPAYVTAQALHEKSLYWNMEYIWVNYSIHGPGPGRRYIEIFFPVSA